MAAEPADEDVERHVRKRFEVCQRLGKGAYWVVWKAIEKRSRKLVALKKCYQVSVSRLYSHASNDPQWLRWLPVAPGGCCSYKHTLFVAPNGSQWLPMTPIVFHHVSLLPNHTPTSLYRAARCRWCRRFWRIGSRLSRRHLTRPRHRHAHT